MESILFYIITKSLFYFKIFQHNARAGVYPAFAHSGEDEKKPFDVIYYLYKMKQFNWLLCVAKNCDWSRKITPLSNLTPASPFVKWKLTAKTELNWEIYKSWRKCWKNQVSFFSSEQPREPKSLDVALTIAGVEKIPRCGQRRGHFIRVLNERSVNDGGDFWLLWLVILKSAWYSVKDTF